MGARYVRKQYLIDRQVQLGLAFRFFVCMLLVALISGWAVYYAVWQTVLTEFHGANLSRMYHAITQRLVLFGLGALFSLSVLSIFFSHRMAGPVYKIRKVLDESVEQGRKPDTIHLRRGDAFKGLADSLNRFFKSMC